MPRTKTAGDAARIRRARPREGVKRRARVLTLLLAVWLVIPAAVPRATGSQSRQDDVISSIGYVYSVAFSPDGKTALTGHDGAVRMWDVETGTQLRVFPSHPGDHGSDAAALVAFMPGGGAVLSATRRTVTLWNLADGKELRHFKIGRGEQSFALAPDGKTLLSGNGIGVIAVWDTRTGKLLRTYRPFRPLDVAVNGLAFTPNGRSILTSSELSPMLALLNLRTGKVSWRVKAAADYSDHVQALAVSPDGTKGLSGGYGGGIKMWNLSTGKLLHSFQYPQGEIQRVLFSLDGKLIVTAGKPDYKQEASPVLLLWDVATGKQLRRFVGHTREVRAVAFSPDGKWLLSGGMNARLRLWDVATGEEVRSFPASPKEPVPAAATAGHTPAAAAPATPAPRRAASDTFGASVMYWATPTPILCKEWYVVVAGTVLETHREVIPELAKQRYTAGTLKVERVLLSLPTEKQAAPSSFAYFKSDGFEGLQRGDKVIVFVNEYDGGYGIVEAAGSNSKLGIKVRSWDDAIVGAVEAMTRDAQTAKHPGERFEALKDPKYAKVWRLFSRKGAGGKGCWE